MWHPRCIPTPESTFDPLWESPLNLVNLQPSCDSSKCKAVKLIPESITIDCSFIFVFFISSMAFKKSQKRYSGRKFWKEERKEFSRETEREYWKNEGIFKLMKKGYWRIWGNVRFVKIDKKRNIRYSEITKNDLQQASSITILKTIFKYILLDTHVYRWNHHSRKYYFMNKFCLSIFTQRSYRYLYSPCPKLSTNFHDCSSLW